MDGCRLDISALVIMDGWGGGFQVAQVSPVQVHVDAKDICRPASIVNESCLVQVKAHESNKWRSDPKQSLGAKFNAYL